MASTIQTATTADGTPVRYRVVKADKRGRSVKCINEKHTVKHPEFASSFVKYHAAWCSDANPTIKPNEKKASRKSLSIAEQMAASTIGGNAADERARILQGK